MKDRLIDIGTVRWGQRDLLVFTGIKRYNILVVRWWWILKSAKHQVLQWSWKVSDRCAYVCLFLPGSITHILVSINYLSEDIQCSIKREWRRGNWRLEMIISSMSLFRLRLSRFLLSWQVISAFGGYVCDDHHSFASSLILAKKKGTSARAHAIHGHTVSQ